MLYRKGRKSPWQVQVRDVQGKIVTRSFEKREDAEAFEAQQRRNRQLQRAGMEAPKEEILLIDFAKTHLKRKAAENTESSIRQDAGRLKNYWLEKFGLRLLTSITSAEIREHLDYIQLELNHSAADRNRHRALMHTLFEDALAHDKVMLNPVSRIPLIDESRRRRKSGKLEPVDQDAYVRAMYEEAPCYGVLADLMLWTGARIMAAAAIQWRDVDFDLGVVRLGRLIERATRKVQDRTKGGGEGGEEVVPLFPILRERLLSWREQSEYIRQRDFIASTPAGRPVAYESYMDAHDRALKRLNLAERFTPHAIRKAFATNAKRSGYTRAEIREMLGHSSEAVTGRYDLKDIEHLVEKGKRLGFGGSQAENVVSVSRLSAAATRPNRIKGD